jgi:erythromycin esterase-like protein
VNGRPHGVYAFLAVSLSFALTLSIDLVPQVDAARKSQASTRAASGAEGAEAFIDWARAHALRLDTTRANGNFGDLKSLKRELPNAEIIGLGEATHGTAEFFTIKHRMIEFLTKEMGFEVFAIEANMPEAHKLNDFVLHGYGDPKELLKGMHFWTWNTQEVLDLILWMRAFNRLGAGHIEFTGFDMQTPTLAQETVRDFVRRYDPAYEKTVTRLYGQVEILRSAQRRGPSFGVATATLSTTLAAGKHVNYSGYIRTENVANGHAGLWLRVDGDSPNRPLLFDNMEHRGAVETTPWTRFEISADVPRDATNINFGVLHTGTGTAWFDTLQLTIDGVPYADKEVFDPDFESASPLGFFIGGQGYQVTQDEKVAHTGRKSLQSKFVGTPELANVNNDPQDKSAVDGCKEILGHLAERRSVFSPNVSETEIDWVIQNARLVLQYAQVRSGEKSRDEIMAENIEWIANHSPASKVILWAHNGHVAYKEYPGYRPMGSYLQQVFGSKYVNFGFSFNQGSFRAFEVGKGVHVFRVGPAPSGSLDQTLAATGVPTFMLDLRKLPVRGPAADWISMPHVTRNVGAAYSEGSAPSFLLSMRAKEAFDFVVFVGDTSPSLGNP